MWSPAESGVGRGRADPRGRRKILFIGCLVLTGHGRLVLESRAPQLYGYDPGQIISSLCASRVTRTLLHPSGSAMSGD